MADSLVRCSNLDLGSAASRDELVSTFDRELVNFDGRPVTTSIPNDDGPKASSKVSKGTVPFCNSSTVTVTGFTVVMDAISNIQPLQYVKSKVTFNLMILHQRMYELLEYELNICAQSILLNGNTLSTGLSRSWTTLRSA